MKPQEKKQKRVQHTGKKIEESLSYTVEVTDKEGRVLQRISAPSRSYVQQWNQLINAHAKATSAGGPYVTVKSTAGVVEAETRSGLTTLQANAGIGVVTYGI
ncbi:unnamed protein product, partial [marine sediment metagenome]